MAEGNATPAKGNILVIEDEPGMAEILRVNLEASGYQVTVAEDGLEALKRLEAERPDLVQFPLGLIHCHVRSRSPPAVPQSAFRRNIHMATQRRVQGPLPQELRQSRCRDRRVAADLRGVSLWHPSPPSDRPAPPDQDRLP